MRKFFGYILVIFLFSTWGIILTNQEAFRENIHNFRRTYIDVPCSKPLAYSIGTVDPRFGIKQSEFLRIISDAERTWEGSSGKDLFRYDQKAELKISLIYDERQQKSNEADKIEENLSNLEASHEEIAQKYSSLSDTYQKRVDRYKADVADYNRELKEYNKDVSYWNNKGGAPDDEYEKLKDKKEDLDELYKKLEKERRAINTLIGKTNELAEEEREVINDYNASLNTYKSRFGEAREFEKGLFDGFSINIYQFKEKADLEMTVIHELGHALGIDHTQDPKSIMYYLMGEQDMDNIVLTKEDVSALEIVCGLDDK